MVGELGGDRAVLGPVAAVVRAHRQFVDEDPAVGGLEQLDGQVAGHAELLGDAQGEGLGLARERLGQVRGGGDHRVAHAVHLDGLDDGVGHGLAVRGADDVGRELADEVDLLFREDRDARLEGGLRVLGVRTNHTPLPS